MYQPRGRVTLNLNTDVETHLTELKPLLIGVKTTSPFPFSTVLFRKETRSTVRVDASHSLAYLDVPTNSHSIGQQLAKCSEISAKKQTLAMGLKK